MPGPLSPGPLSGPLHGLTASLGVCLSLLLVGGTAASAQTGGDASVRTPVARMAEAPAGTDARHEPMGFAGASGGRSRPGDPAPGTVIRAANVGRYDAFLGPSMRWAIERGMNMEVVAPRPIPLEPARLRATEKYAPQARLSADKLQVENYVAGLPFPLVDENDPDAAVKLMFNFENRILVDDLDARNFDCDTGSIGTEGPMRVERRFILGHFRRLYHVGRLYHEPIHTWPTPDGVRYREALYPILEPFDLKGVGITYNRYLAPSRQDDSWLYYPLLKRVRRLSTAARSEALFGQDTDIDSYGGFAGNPAWMAWRMLGRKRLLGSLHGRNFPARWAAGSADFMFDDTWEPRDVYVIEGRSKLPGYAYSRRVIYIDRESFVIPYTELYDQNGELWKAWVNQFKLGRKPRPDAVRVVYDYEQQFLPAVTMFDMQLGHATKCRIPSPDFPGEEGWYFNFGDAEGTTEEAFSVQYMISQGR